MKIIKDRREKSVDRERSHGIEQRCSDAILILSTMMIGSGLVCCIGSVIPEQLMVSAAITMVCSGLGVMVFTHIKMEKALERLDSM